MTALNNIKQKSKRGGKRQGAGRKPGSRDIASPTQLKSIATLAQSHAKLAMNTLAAIAKGGESEAARVSAANSILDRGYGRATPTPDSGAPGGLNVTVNITGTDVNLL